jgi:putative spermidine/putrescine transport system ATP-binding protein
MAFLELIGARKVYGQAVAVEHADLAIERGTFLSLLGPSGCGKTTTLRMIAGFEQPSAGTIRLDGADITRLPPSRRHMGIVFQSYALFPNMTVAQNIAFGLRLRRVSSRERARKVAELLGLIDLEHLGGRFPHQLSGGQQQRVALARALAIEPQVLLLDEPLSALDAKIRVSLRNEIRAIQRTLRITTIYVTHDQEEALSLSDQIVVMNKGRIEQIGTPLEIYNHPRTPFVASFVGTLNVLHARVLDPVAGSVTVGDQPLAGIGAVRELRPGDPVTLALRPEAIVPDAVADGANRLRGTIEDVVFLGGIVRVRARIGTDTVNFDVLNRPGITIPERDTVANLVFPGDAFLVLDEVPTEALVPEAV